MVLQVWKLLQLRAGNIWRENTQLQRCEPGKTAPSTAGHTGTSAMVSRGMRTVRCVCIGFTGG